MTSEPDLVTWATTSEMEAEPTMTLYLCLRSIPAWIHAFEQNKQRPPGYKQTNKPQTLVRPFWSNHNWMHPFGED